MKAIVSVLLLIAVVRGKDCEISKTTVGGSLKPQNICSGDLVFSDEFDKFDLTTWQHENTLAGGGNWEFQWYTNNRSNSYVSDGKLYIKPTLTSDHLGEKALTSQTLDINGGAIADKCTNPAFYGCSRTGNPDNILNPVKSARIRTMNSFHYKYGRLEVKAKLPMGEWLWPAIWLMPRNNAYGFWPSSGEIDIVEGRGNKDLIQNGNNIGIEQMSSTLHWCPNYCPSNKFNTHWEKNRKNGFNDWHVYEFIWTPDAMTFIVDGEQYGSVAPPEGGFWELANATSGNPWRGSTKMAPFDEEFYIIINLAVGGISYFPDDATNPKGKPWENNSPIAMKKFWDKRGDWLPTWHLDSGDDAALQVDYIRVYAL